MAQKLIRMLCRKGRSHYGLPKSHEVQIKGARGGEKWDAQTGARKKDSSKKTCAGENFRRCIVKGRILASALTSVLLCCCLSSVMIMFSLQANLGSRRQRSLGNSRNLCRVSCLLVFALCSYSSVFYRLLSEYSDRRILNITIEQMKSTNKEESTDSDMLICILWRSGC